MADRLTVLDQLLDTPDLREGRRHRADAPGSDLGGMGSQFHALAQAAAAYVHDHLEPFGYRGHPLFGQSHPLLGGQHVALTRGAVDEDALQAVLVQHGSIGRNGFAVHIAVAVERRERRVDKSFDLFHSI